MVTGWFYGVKYSKLGDLVLKFANEKKYLPMIR